MQRYTIFCITVNALHVSGGFSAHHQELKNCTHSIWYMPSLLAATASVGEFQLTHASDFSAYHQELKNFIHSNWYMLSLLAASASVGELELTNASGSSKQAWHLPDAVCTVFELLMTSRETA